VPRWLRWRDEGMAHTLIAPHTQFQLQRCTLAAWNRAWRAVCTSRWG